MALERAGVALPDRYGVLGVFGIGVDVVRFGARWTKDTAMFALAVPGRVEALLDEVSALMVRINAVVDAAQQVVAEAQTTTRSADGVITSASKASVTALELVELFDPIAQRSAPFAKKFVDNLDENEVDAAIAMVDQLPGLVEHMEAVIPILATLDTVAPEIHELLGVTKDVRRAVIGIPGFKFFRNRGQDKLDDEELQE
ncbi:ribulose 1,5-bisphosphate carboxylase large subunit [Rhodococcus sp. P1Y]|uniref:ribulose 1,5-bisphosphate carboxylase large subunit n=1 Tax=Rhodococcus sp. P1Y TaxID=1302308 RepID=UPI000EAD01BA|nr:ribulose 1,5-bisphosphate carboxylase large subunit [Rhodococcus sp. P1Y]AYJ49214.1 ribulose 1,5-bisphosphate carboxylase large subunit [Rhodococcus sp. P1Y]